MGNIFLNQTLSYRVERAEALAAVAAAEVCRRQGIQKAAAVEELAGGFAVFCGPNSPVTQAVGLGLTGPVTDTEFSRLEQFYLSRGEPVRVETSPLADATLFQQFARNQYATTEFTNVMAKPLAPVRDEFQMPAGISITKANSQELDAWSLTVSQGFSEDNPVSQEIVSLMKCFAMADNVEAYFARIDGQLAGGGTLILRDGIAGLFGASTLPQFRNRGIQSALLAFRMARAAQTGCDLAVCLAQPGSSSNRNIIRQGFETLYTRVKYERSSESAKS